MKERASLTSRVNLQDERTSGGVLWVLLSVIFFALVLLPVIVR